jgi:anti-sigma factor RsiW
MECGKIRKDLHAYLEGLSTPDENRVIEQHIAECSGCRAVLEELRMTINQINNLEELEPPPWLTQKVMTRIRAEKAERGSFLSRLFRGLRVEIPLTAAATVLIAVTAVILFREMEPKVDKALSPVVTEQPSAPLQQQAPRSIDPHAREDRTSGNSLSASLKEARETSPPGRATAPVDKRVNAPLPPAEEPVRQRNIESVPIKKEALRERDQDDRPSPVLENKALASSGELSAPPVVPPAQALQKPAGAFPQTGSLKDENALRAAPESTAAASRARTRNEKAAGKALSPYERSVISKYANGSPQVVVTFRVIAGGQKKIMEERFDESGRRHGLHTAYDESGKLSAEVRYEHGRIDSLKEYNAAGTLRSGESGQDWPWLHINLK